LGRLGSCDEGRTQRKIYRHLRLPEIEVLNIEDEFEFMDEELVQLLTDRINDTLKTVYKL
jgi:protein-tyrosine phosphatase